MLFCEGIESVRGNWERKQIEIKGSFLTGRAAGSPRVVAWVEGVEVFGVEMVLRNPHGIAEALEVNDLPFSEKFNRVSYVGIVGQTKNVVVGRSRLLLCYYHVFATFFGCQKLRKSLIGKGFGRIPRVILSVARPRFR